MHYPQADTIDIAIGQVFGWLFIVALGLSMYWFVWYFINKYLLNPLIKKSLSNETIEEDQKGKD